ncbi:hypothetical protein ACP70R_002874 [Stipagrostis hirtigluma subsp. patula]
MPAHGAVTRADVDANLRPCVGYVTGEEAPPPAECCAGVTRLRAMPSGTAERRQAAARYQGLQSDAIRNLPGKCGAPNSMWLRDVDSSSARRRRPGRGDPNPPLPAGW